MKILLSLPTPSSSNNESSAPSFVACGLAGAAFVHVNDTVFSLNLPADGDGKDKKPPVQCVDSFWKGDEVSDSWWIKAASSSVLIVPPSHRF